MSAKWKKLIIFSKKQFLAYRLKKLNASIPYIIIVTQDITENSVNELKEQGVIVHNDSKIDTPYIKTHKARKYQVMSYYKFLIIYFSLFTVYQDPIMGYDRV